MKKSPTDNVKQVLKRLQQLGDPRAVEGMAKYGIATKHACGVSVPNLRKMAKEIGTNHGLALQLWASGIHEARILASMIDDPAMVDETQMETWVKQFDSWDVCDQCCLNLFSKTAFAYEKCAEWPSRNEEFVKRSGFALMACLAVADKSAGDRRFEKFLPIIRREATDDRNYVKKAVNWALRQIGKRNLNLNRKAIETAQKIEGMDSRSARWVASDALRELTSEAVQERLRARGA